MENAKNNTQIESKTTDNENSSSNGTQNALENNQAEELIIIDENEKPCDETEQTTPSKKKKKKKKLPVSKLLARLNKKEFKGLHTNGFDIPRKLFKKLKTNRLASWQEDDLDMDEENIEPPNKKSKLSEPKTTANQKQTAQLKNVDSNRVESTAAAPKFKRSNLLKIDYKAETKKRKLGLSNSNETIHDHPVTEQEKNDSVPISQDESDCLPWKAKCFYTEQLHSYFTVQSQVDFRLSDEFAGQNDTQSPAIKRPSLKYKCKICEENGISPNSKVTGFVTCQYGKNSNMKRHIREVMY